MHYCFWRTPTKVSTDPNHAPRELLKQWGESITLDQNGGLTCSGISHSLCEEALRLVIFIAEPGGSELNSDDTWALAKRTLHDEIRSIGGKKAIDPGQYLRRLEILANEFFREPTSPYLLITNLSVEALPADEILVDDCKIKPIQRSDFVLPEIITRTADSSPIQTHLKTSRYKWVSISTFGRSIFEAAGRAIDAVSQLRAIWTFCDKYKSHTVRLGSSRTRPLTNIHCGPFYSLHNLDGSAATDRIYWADRTPAEDYDVFRPGKGWNRLEAERRFIYDALARWSPAESREIKSMLLRYISAMDQTNHDLALLQLWSILEKITGQIGAKYEETIQRAIWPVSNREHVRELLNCIRIQRNRYVHATHSAADAEQVAQLTKSVLEPHFENLIFNTFQLKKVSEYSELLSLPVDPSTLKRQLNLLTKATNIHALSQLTLEFGDGI